MTCPGPHLQCRGCGGRGKVTGRILRVNPSLSGVTVTVLLGSGCQPCGGNAYFCLANPKGEVPHEGATPVALAYKIPPV